MARYTPGNVPTDPAEMAGFLRLEFQKISQAIEAPVEQLDLRVLAAQPTKFRNTTVVKANGTTWNPGSGAGTYSYDGAVWKFLG